MTSFNFIHLQPAALPLCLSCYPPLKILITKSACLKSKELHVGKELYLFPVNSISFPTPSPTHVKKIIIINRANESQSAQQELWSKLCPLGFLPVGRRGTCSPGLSLLVACWFLSVYSLRIHKLDKSVHWVSVWKTDRV